MNPTTPNIGRTLTSVATGAVQSPTQKYVIVTQKPAAVVQQPQQQTVNCLFLFKYHYSSGFKLL